MLNESDMLPNTLNNTRVFVVIKHVLDGKETVYTPSAIHESQVDSMYRQCYSELKQLAINQSKTLKMTTNAQHCEISTSETVTTPGWLWNKQQEQSQLLYIIYTIPLFESPESAESDNSFSTSPQFPNVNKCECECKYNNENQINQITPPTPLAITVASNKSLDICYGSGYANTPLFPKWSDQLRDELKNKLTQPNYGLRYTKL